MIINEFVIGQKLPSLNEYIAACRSNPYVGAKFKKEIEEVIGGSIRQALTKQTLFKPNKAVRVHFEWHEQTQRRDADNVVSAKKFILDALVSNGVLVDDSRKYVKGFTDDVVDDKTDFVRVELIEIGGRQTMKYIVCKFGLELEAFDTITAAHEYILEEMKINKKLKIEEELSIKVKEC